MFRKCSVALVVVIALQLFATFFGFASPPVSRAGPSTSGKVVFSLFNTGDLSTISSQYNLTGIKALFTPGAYLANVPAKVSPDSLALTMAGDARIDTVSPDYGMTLIESGSFFNMDANSFRFNPDSGLNESTANAYITANGQWAWQKTNLGDLRNLAQANNVLIGQGITVAVLDTGVDSTHPDLQGHVLPGYDALGVYPDGRDVQGHGTFVAGIIAQIAPGATILPVRVLDPNGLGTVDSIMNGLQYAIDKGAKVVNLSLSSDMDSSTLHKLIQNARSKGVSVLAAAGNDNSGAKYFPASYGEDIAVAATDERDYRADFSNWQGYVKLSSPGVNIYSTWLGGGYGWASGTSFSTPIVAGAAVIVRSLHPDYSPDKVRDTLKGAVDKFGAGCSCGGMGTGRLNFLKLVN
jgi:subtilisin family serine protease